MSTSLQTATQRKRSSHMFQKTRLLSSSGQWHSTHSLKKRCLQWITITPHDLASYQVLLYPFTSLLAEFGGSLGLFLGFSFVTISDGIQSLAKWLKNNVNLFWSRYQFLKSGPHFVSTSIQLEYQSCNTYWSQLVSLCITRSLGPLWSPTSSWRPFGPCRPAWLHVTHAPIHHRITP